MNKKLTQLGVLVDKKQLKMIDDAAKSIGLSRSAFVRFVLTQHIVKGK